MEENIYYIVLSKFKELEKNYTVALTEASCDELYEELKKDFDKVADFQRKLFNEMNSKGYYKLKYSNKEEIKDLIDELNTKYDQIDV